MIEPTRRGILRLAGLGGLRLAVAPALSFGQQPPGPSRQFDTIVGDYMRRYAVPGLSLAFVRGRSLLFARGYGEANKSDRAPVRTESRFRIASNSKAFTSTAIFTLVEGGRVRLQDRVFAPDGILRQYSSIGPRREWLHAITVHELLTHTGGGWGNESNDPMFEMLQLNQTQLIEWTLKTHPLQYPPGKHYAYSNFGYCVLGRVIEQVTGMPYASYVRQNILDPVGIKNMAIGMRRTARNEVHYYGQDGENPYNFDVTRMDSHGGWIATPTDVARFLAALFSPEDGEGVPPLISLPSLKEQTRGTAANPAYACGFEINKAGNCWHVGSLPGTLALMVHTRSGMAWAVMLNTRSNKSAMESDLDAMMWRLAESVPGWKAG